jgi:glucose/arabinose dehydrogenase
MRELEPFSSREEECRMITRKLATLGIMVILAVGPALFRIPAHRHEAAASGASAAASMRLMPVLTGLNSPVLVTNARDGSNRLFVVEQGGVIKVLKPGESSPTVFLDITAAVLFGGEQGLLGLTFHPQFASNRRFFVDYTRRPDGATVIAEYHASATDPNIADTGETALLVIPQPFANHNGGMVEFGPDGFLYIGMGDGGSGNDPGNRAQDITQLLGKMLRIDVDHAAGAQHYSSPPDNPFVGSANGRPEIYAYGLRNPWRYSFDRGTGEIYAGDVGQDAVEEIDIIARGGNYGWRIWEGSSCTGNDPGLCQVAGFTLPIIEYHHAGGRCAVTGGYVYRGAQSSLPMGGYVYGDYCTGEIFLFQNGSSSVALASGLSISSFGEDESGEIYVVDLNGSVQRITAGAACAFSLSPTSRLVPAVGRAGVVRVSAPAGCGWTAISNASWITITQGESGTGSGQVGFSVASNRGNTQSRTGTLTVAGQTVTIKQGKPR